MGGRGIWNHRGNVLSFKSVFPVMNSDLSYFVCYQTDCWKFSVPDSDIPAECAQVCLLKEIAAVTRTKANRSDMAEQTRINNQSWDLARIRPRSAPVSVSVSVQIQIYQFSLFLGSEMGYLSLTTVNRTISRRDRSAAKVRFILWY